MSHPSEGPKNQVPGIQVIGVTGIPEVRPGDRLAETIFEAAAEQGLSIENGDIVVVTQKIVSKAEGQLVDLSTVEPSSLARRLAAPSGRDPRLMELVLRESQAIVRTDTARGIIIAETRHGFVCANAGIDTSNVPGSGFVSLLPKDPDASARRIRQKLVRSSGSKKLAVVISDTFGRAWREGHANFAIGVAGMEVMKDYRGTADAFGNILQVTRIAVLDELAAAAELVMDKATGVPVAIIRGYPFAAGRGGIGALLRDRSADLFR